MADDQSLYLRTELGLVVLLGCAHRGAVNIIRHARELTGTARVYLVAGGTHLGPAPERQITATIAELKELDVRWLGLSHCTGLKVAARLDAQLGGRFFFNNAGSVITLPIGS
jgi:7,8-dihydropterin-6-yl-methyl-4-(beta-D-ribofuranosyl)aminobenzene 5'-phosphate synthase